MGVVALPSADRRRAGELGLLGVVRHRISKAVLVRDDDWPRAGPYPDRWLARWHARVYARELATGSIPFHGEWDRLQRWLVAGHVGPMLVGWPGVVLLVARPRQAAEPGATAEAGGVTGHRRR